MHGGGGQGRGLLRAPTGVMLRSAAMLEPAHDGLVLVQHLHAIDAEIVIVLARIAGTFGHHQRPGDQRRRLARPAGLYRQFRQVDVTASKHNLLAGGFAHRLGLHRQDGFHQRQQFGGLAEAARRLRLAQLGQQLTDFAQVGAGGALHAAHGDAHRHPLDRAEQVDQHRHVAGGAVGLDGFFEDHRWSALGDQPGLDLGHLQHGGDGFLHPHQRAVFFQAGQEIAQRTVTHSAGSAWME